MIDNRDMNLQDANAIAKTAEAQGALFYRFRVLPIFIAVAYALFLSLLPLDNFLDRVNYFLYAQNSYTIQGFYMGSYAAYLSNEPLWLFMNVQLSNVISDEAIVRTFIFFPTFVTTYIVTCKRQFSLLVACLVMIIPGVAQNYIVHIRQGVAVAIFLAGYFASDRRVRYGMIGISPFVHSAFFIIVAIYFANEILRVIDVISIRTKIIIITSIIVAAVLFMELFMSSASFRQLDEYRDISTEISGLGFLLWFLVFALLVSSGTRIIEENLFSIASLMFYLMIYFFAPFAGRIIECVIIPVFFSGMMLPGWKRWAFVGLIFVQSAAFYILNSSSHWFGWGL